jgi:hypothetical protein
MIMAIVSNMGPIELSEKLESISERLATVIMLRNPKAKATVNRIISSL